MALSKQDKMVYPYLVGDRVYNGYSPSPRVGPIGNRGGYAERDRKHKARRDAVLRRLKSKSKGKEFSADALRKV